MYFTYKYYVFIVKYTLLVENILRTTNNPIHLSRFLKI